MVGEADGVGLGECVGEAVGDAVGEAVGDAVGDGVGVLLPPLSASDVESTKKFVTRVPFCTP